ncbi:TPA: hypothetical protein ACGFAK_004634 [Serratia marcescens]|uniref:hypothetical protein n=1 Tax=Serratia TaxID=613 RepID=UPI001020914A|nr:MULTISPECIES: hypothetical protein [Serratia]MBP1133544.1 hypothetical protein [Serratia sp. PL17]RYM67333.1 hypothetical protein BSQ99_24510 [Serratia liquefaciens]HBL7241986.1 hypothetical protein [Serratia liquefaciens]HDS5480599.1 hypothetical protein [Serratia liquefaciens]
MAISSGIFSNPHLMVKLTSQQQDTVDAFFAPGKDKRLMLLAGPVCGLTNNVTNIAVANLIDKRRSTLVVSQNAAKYAPFVISAVNEMLPRDQPLVITGNRIYQRHEARTFVEFVDHSAFTPDFVALRAELPIDIIIEGLAPFASTQDWQQSAAAINPDTILICDEPLVMNGEKPLCYELATSEQYQVMHHSTLKSSLVKSRFNISSLRKPEETEEDFQARLEGVFR